MSSEDKLEAAKRRAAAANQVLLASFRTSKLRAAMEAEDPESDEEEVVQETTRERNKREKAEAAAVEKEAKELKRANDNKERGERLQRQTVIRQRAEKDKIEKDRRDQQIRAIAAAHIAAAAAKPSDDDDGWGVDPSAIAVPVVPEPVHPVSPPPASPVKRESEPPPQPSRARRLVSGASDALSALFRSRVATATAGHIRSAVSSVMRGSSSVSALPVASSSVSVADASRSELEQLQADTTAVEQVAHEVDAAATAAEDALTPHSSRREVAQAVALRDAAASFTEAAAEQKEEIEAKLDESYMPGGELDLLWSGPLSKQAERGDPTTMVDVDPATNPLINVILEPTQVDRLAGYYMGSREAGGLGVGDAQMYQWLWQAYATTNGTTELPIQSDTPWLEYQMARLFGLRSGEHFRDDLDHFMVTHGAWQPAHVRKMQRLRDRAVAEINTAPLSPTMSADEYAAQLRALIETLTGVRIAPLPPVARRATTTTLAMLALVLCI